MERCCGENCVRCSSQNAREMGSEDPQSSPSFSRNKTDLLIEHDLRKSLIERVTGRGGRPFGSQALRSKSEPRKCGSPSRLSAWRAAVPGRHPSNRPTPVWNAKQRERRGRLVQRGEDASRCVRRPDSRQPAGASASGATSASRRFSRLCPNPLGRARVAFRWPLSRLLGVWLLLRRDDSLTACGGRAHFGPPRSAARGARLRREPRCLRLRDLRRGRGLDPRIRSPCPASSGV